MKPMLQTPIEKKEALVMFLLALQFGLQPILTKKYIRESICKSSVIMCQEVIKFGLSFLMFHISDEEKEGLDDWSILMWLTVAGIPAVLYVIQSLATLLAYQNLDALTFNVLNQTKTLSAALCCYLVIGKKQSMRQIVALFIMLLSALIMEQVFNLDNLSMGSVEQKAEVTKALQAQARRVSHGVLPVLLASFLSGLAGALCQKNLQNHGRNPYLFCMELCAASSIILTASLLVSPDGQVIKERGFWGDDWDYRVFIPIVTNAVGGILVGLVTKYAGSVRKGFALIFGILISGLLQSENVSAEQVIGGTLAAVSLYIHSSKGSSNSDIEQKQDTEATLPLVSNEMSSSKVPVKQQSRNETVQEDGVETGALLKQ